MNFKNLTMKNPKILLFLILVCSVLFFSCQKEYSVEEGLLTSGTWQFNDASKLYTGDIDSAYIETTGSTKSLTLTGKSTNGQQDFLLHLYATDTFRVGTYKASLFQSDFQYFSQAKNIYQADQFIGEFIVTVTAIGNNNITGIFSGISEDSTGALIPITLGKFTSKINLSGNGTGGGTGGGTSVGTLGATAGTCAPVTNNGTFTQGIVLNSTNTVTVQVNVTTPGTYIISTNSVNGVSFSKSGTFTSTGVNSIILVGAGTPLMPGLQTFTVSFGGSTCSFPITFAPGTVPPVVGDYFPTTAGSFWAYGNTNIADSFLISATSRTKTIGTLVYNVFTYDDIPPSGTPDELYFRKPGGDYYEYLNTDFFGFDSATNSPANIDFIFLKDNVPQGTIWQSPSVTGKAPINNVSTTITVYIKMTLLAKSVAATSGSVTSNDVIKVKYEYFASIGPLPAVVIFTEERWFAKGIGLIYNSFKNGTTTEIFNIGRKLIL
jgi:hypothetical protein